MTQSIFKKRNFLVKIFSYFKSYCFTDSNETLPPVINSTASSLPLPEKYNPPMQMAPQAPAQPVMPSCPAPSIPTAVPSRESLAPVPIPSVFDPVLESPPQMTMPSTNNIPNCDKPPGPVMTTTSNAVHSIDGEWMTRIYTSFKTVNRAAKPELKSGSASDFDQF